jgi:hypothetical protein
MWGVDLILFLELMIDVFSIPWCLSLLALVNYLVLHAALVGDEIIRVV